MSDSSETSLHKIDQVQDLLDRLRLDHEARRYGAIIVEGPADASVLEAVLSADLRYFPVSGRVNVLRAADRLDEEYLPGVICVADLDFDHEATTRASQRFLVFTDDADIEAMLYWSLALDRVLDEWAIESKYRSYGGIVALRRVVEDGVSVMAILRSWSTVSGAGLDFGELDLHESINKKTLALNVVGIVGRLSEPQNVQRKDVQDALGLDPPVCPYTERLVARGRDRLAFVTAALRSAIGSLSKQQVADGLVERSLRLAVRPADFQGTAFLARFELALAAAKAT